MRSLRFTVHFASDIGDEHANEHVGRELAEAIGDLLTLGETDLVTPGEAYAVRTADGREIRVAEVDWTGGA